MPFKSKRHAPVACTVPPIGVHGKDRTALNNGRPNVQVGGNVNEDITELHAKGIDVDNENKPLDEGAVHPPPLEYPNPHNIAVPMHCPHCERNSPNARGRWMHHCWDKIAGYTEFELFRMALPEEFVERVMLPMMNATLRVPLSIGEFYKWLGCKFFMACFQVVEGADLDVQGRPILAHSHHVTELLHGNNSGDAVYRSADANDGNAGVS
jgi:hypothetical protein